MAKFMIVDDHPLAIMAIKTLLETEGHEVVAETGDAHRVLHLIEKHAPEGLILDIDLPNKDGIEVLKSIRDKQIMIPVIVMSGKNAQHYAPESMRYGANGFISKKNELENLKVAVKAVLGGYAYFPLQYYDHGNKNGMIHDGDKIRQLSTREYQVLKMLSEGIEIIEIAAQLEISNKTVSTYKARIMEKLSLRNQKELLDFARINHIS
ncbi:response regulator transcription factor [Pantoea sp.]|uniref:response regulator transcription factor n=1 Tax=Pantoea sp. TaxID=69393 RepID=UPI0031DA623E